MEKNGPLHHEKPLKHDGSEYTLNDIDNNQEQQHVVYLVLQKLKEYIEFPSKYNEDPTLTFSPLHLTVMGVGGTGKSFLISVLVTALKKLLYDENIVTAVINAPTGAAAFNVKGKTCHNTWKINVKNPAKPISNEKKTKLQQNLQHLLMLCIDERSMLSKSILGAIDRCSKDTVHKNTETSEKPFGGIPIVLLTGDDHQLPSVTIGEKGQGITYYFRNEKSKVKRDSQTLLLERDGENAFFYCSENVVQLNEIKRLDSGSNRLKKILNDVRNGGMDKIDAKYIMKRHIRNIPFHKKQWLEENAVYLFATKELNLEHNMKKLNHISNENNPVCLLQTQFTKTHCEDGRQGNKKHFDQETIPTKCMLCKGAKVCLTNKNFHPNWGLYNGALGTVIDIKFAPNENPQTGHLPQYVVVDFPDYKGPPWINEHPTYVPVPTVQTCCQHSTHCCQAKFIPLTLAFSRTIHKFQGMEAGQTKQIKAIVVDVGSTSFEAINPGLLYTALSRASSLGDESLTNSAIYFSGPLTYDRLTNVKYLRSEKNTNRRKVYQKVYMRDKWIEHITSNIKKTPTLTLTEMQKLKNWANTFKISTSDLTAIIDFHKQHKWFMPSLQKPKLQR